MYTSSSSPSSACTSLFQLPMLQYYNISNSKSINHSISPNIIFSNWCNCMWVLVLELSPSGSSNVYQPWYFLPSTQDLLLPAGLPTHLVPLLLCLRFGFGWPLCAFTNYIYLLTYLLLSVFICSPQFCICDLCEVCPLILSFLLLAN